MTDIYALIDQVRASYIDAFRAFVEKNHRSCKLGAAEVKLRLGGQSKLAQQIYCVDFINNDDGNGDVVELVYEQYYRFTGLRGQLGSLSVTFNSLRWGDVMIAHDLADTPDAALAAWFEHWFDPSDQRHDPNAEFSHTVHSLLIEPRLLQVDFGTAPSDAFWSLLELLEEAGARTAAISCGE